MLHRRRKELEELRRREADGESFWTTTFSDAVRERLAGILELLANPEYERPHKAMDYVLRLLRTELGIDVTRWRGTSPFAVASALKALDETLLPSLLEAIYLAMDVLVDRNAQANWEDAVNRVLNEHRISFEMVNGEMIERESQELHAEVVAPALRLLSGRPGWDKVESAYQDALREISQDHPADAITDAATALQEALTLLGCTGNSLGNLAKSAQSNGLLAPHDATLNEALRKVIDWVSADRSEMGDAHQASTATRDDAWLAVHVVGALLLRLAGDPRN